MSSPSDTGPQPLSVLSVEEGSCLLRSYALHPIPRKPGEVVILYYSQDPERGGETDDGGDNGPDQCGEIRTVPESELYTPQTPTKADGEGTPTATGGGGAANVTGTGTDPGNIPIKINGKYSHTSQKSYSTIWVMDRVGCQLAQANIFINAVVGAPSKAPEVLEANSLDKFGNFITGVSLRASYTPRYFTIFVSIPYLGVGYATQTYESRTLREYRLRQPTETQVNNMPAIPAARPDILVHQTWLFSFNDERIGIFRSKDDHYSDRAPLFPYQKRMAASQALVHIISNLLTSSEYEALKIFRSKVNDMELKFEDNNTDDKVRNEALKSYGSYIKDVSTMIRIVRYQIGYLEDLRQIYENSYDSKRLTGNPRPHRNSYPIPLLRKQPEQLEDVMKSLTAVIAERERFYNELRILVKDLELAKTLCLEGDEIEKEKTLKETLIRGQIDSQDATRVALEAQAEAQVTISGALEAQAKSQKNMEETLKEQGQTITVFTFVTAVFLPLGFFCSYYAIPENFGGAKFWSVAGPVTSAMTVLMALFLWAPDDKIKKALGLWRETNPENQEEPQSGTTQERGITQSPETTKSGGLLSRNREKTQDSISEA